MSLHLLLSPSAFLFLIYSGPRNQIIEFVRSLSSIWVSKLWMRGQRVPGVSTMSRVAQRLFWGRRWLIYLFNCLFKTFLFWKNEAYGKVTKTVSEILIYTNHQDSKFLTFHIFLFLFLSLYCRQTHMHVIVIVAIIIVVIVMAEPLESKSQTPWYFNPKYFSFYLLGKFSYVNTAQ